MQRLPPRTRRRQARRLGEAFSGACKAAAISRQSIFRGPARNLSRFFSSRKLRLGEPRIARLGPKFPSPSLVEVATIRRQLGEASVKSTERVRVVRPERLRTLVARLFTALGVPEREAETVAPLLGRILLSVPPIVRLESV